MKFIVLFTILGTFLSSAYAAEHLESEKSQKHEPRSKHQSNFSALVETAMDLLGPDPSSTQNSKQIAAKVRN